MTTPMLMTVATASVFLVTLYSAMPAGHSRDGVATTQRVPVESPPPVAAHRAVLDKYCVTCHNERRKAAGLLLDQVDLARVGEHAEVWEKVLRKLQEQSMPPPRSPRPGSDIYGEFAHWLEAALDGAAAANVNPGRPAIHRLNRTEYVNAIRDLLELDVDGEALLPADDSGYGFDNIADVLSVSPTLLERYLASAQKVVRLAVGDVGIAPTFEKYTVSTFLYQDDRMSEDQPFGARGGAAIRHRFPLDGDYVLRVRLQRTFEDVIRGLRDPQSIDVFVDSERVTTLTIGGGDITREGRTTADSTLEVRFPALAGTRVVVVTFPKVFSYPEGPRRPKPALTSFAWSAATDGLQAVSTIEIGGPFDPTGSGDTSSRRAIFTCRPSTPRSDGACARAIVSRFARRAYRRPVAERDLRPLLAMYEAGKAEGGFEAGVSRALTRILVAPEFLFRLERDPANVAPGAAYPLSDLELASRLSFFLWSSIPDDELLDVAARGRLRTAAVLEQQVRRMLQDPRSRSLVTNFAGQWLWLRNLRVAAPNPDIFPEWEESLRDALRTETELFVESTIREDRSVLDLLDADYTFVNQRLAEHYDIPNIYGSHFRRVTVPDDRRRGLLGHGSILTTTSYDDRTSPVKRGAFLLENILGAPPPPPPPDVPTLPDNQQNGKALTMRERMAQHRTNAVCASCHSRIDPLGFALENFDAIGRWRATDMGNPIDASGTLLDGTTFDGVIQMRKSLLSQPDPFVEAFTERLLTYAAGRGLEYFDKPTLRAIVRSASRDNYRWSSIILGVVTSQPFQMRRAALPADAGTSVAAEIRR